MPYALQPWLENVPIKRQCELLSALRGPDTYLKPAVKSVVRWLRRQTVLTVKEGHFTKPLGRLPSAKRFGRAIEWASVHYAAHLREGLIVLLEYYPAQRESLIAYRYANEMDRRFPG